MFGEVGHLRVFWVPFVSRVLVTVTVGSVLWLLAYLNLRPALRGARPNVIEMAGRGGTYRPSARQPAAGLLEWWVWLLAGVAFSLLPTGVVETELGAFLISAAVALVGITAINGLKRLVPKFGQ